MEPVYHDAHVNLYCGDALEVLRTLPQESVRCVVTSPPYSCWGLRDYGTAEWDGGDAECDHEPPQEWIDHNFNANSAFGKGAGTQSAAAKGRWYRQDGSCRCGATRVDLQLGAEPTPEEYVASMVEVFREVRRVLRDDGTLWLNLGDSYAGSWGAQSRGGPPSESSTLRGNGHVGGGPKAKSLSAVQIAQHPKGTKTGSLDRTPGLKAKDLCGIPWRVAFALQADGWWLRSDIIWHKPNPMPESVTDRPTKAHEYVFLLSKSDRYFYDHEAVAEESSYPGDSRHLRADTRKDVDPMCSDNGSRARTGNPTGTTRNRRTVWTITTKPYLQAHFATFPPELPEICIKAGSAPGDTVLDPFAGAGTTLYVAKHLNREAIGIELNPEYCDLIAERCSQEVLAL